MSSPAGSDPRGPRKYSVQKGDDDVKVMTEQKLRNALKENDLSGLELVRTEAWGDEPAGTWMPLHQTALFREVVPHVEGSHQAALRRVTRPFLGHLATFLAVGAGFTIATGAPPFWLAFWGIGLAMHGARAVPKFFELKKLGASMVDWTSTEMAQPEVRAALPEAEGEFAEELNQTRQALASAKLDDKEKAELHVAIDELAHQVAALDQAERQLAAQTASAKKASLERERAEAQANLDDANGDEVAIFREQIDLLEERLSAITGAERARRTLKAKRSVAQQKVEQLRLELTTRSTDTDARGLAERMEQIRLQMAAARELDQLLDDGSLPTSQTKAAAEPAVVAAGAVSASARSDSSG